MKAVWTIYKAMSSLSTCRKVDVVATKSLMGLTVAPVAAPCPSLTTSVALGALQEVEMPASSET